MLYCRAHSVHVVHHVHFVQLRQRRHLTPWDSDAVTPINCDPGLRTRDFSDPSLSGSDQ
jgi:hypothetical protein